MREDFNYCLALTRCMTVGWNPIVISGATLFLLLFSVEDDSAGRSVGRQTFPCELKRY